MKIIKLVVVAALACVAAGCRTGDALSFWTDGAASKRAIVDYVAAVTDESSPDFIPPERRIAVFDLDGTLFCETDPTYFDWQMFEKRVLDDPSCHARDKLKDAARMSREKGVYPPLGNERERITAEAYKGISLDELDAFICQFMKEPEPGYPGMKRGEMFYLPMVQLVEYLVGKEFTVYVVSGSDRFIVRALVCGRLPVPPWRVIGSDCTIVSRTQNGEDALFYTFGKDDVPILDGSLIVKNLQMNKVSAIIREIGVKPVLSFGNSHTDASMANYVIGGNEYKAAAFMLVCDDMKRENGNPKKAAEMKKECEKYGWIPVSMRDDWKVIYAFRKR
jgi:hypothetical protein